MWFQLNNYQVVRRNGKVTAFDTSKISIALTKAFISVEGGTAAASTRIHQAVESLTQTVLDAFTRRMPDGGTLHIEDIQDQVELALMRNGEQKVARAYVLYREERTRERAAEIETNTELREKTESVSLNVTRIDGVNEVPVVQGGRGYSIITMMPVRSFAVCNICTSWELSDNTFFDQYSDDTMDFRFMEAMYFCVIYLFAPIKY